MAIDNTPSFVMYQGDGSNTEFNVPMSKNFYGEIYVAFVRRGAATYEDLPTTFELNEDNTILTWTGETLNVGDFIVIRRKTLRQQPHKLPNNQKHIEDMVDNIAHQVREVADRMDAALRIDPTYKLDSGKMNPYEWLETIVRSVDSTVRGFRFRDNFIEFSKDDPKLPQGEKSWIGLVQSENIASIRYRRIVIDNKTYDLFEYDLGDGEWRNIFNFEGANFIVSKDKSVVNIQTIEFEDFEKLEVIDEDTIYNVLNDPIDETGSGFSITIPDAPRDGWFYMRKDGQWVRTTVEAGKYWIKVPGIKISYHACIYTQNTFIGSGLLPGSSTEKVIKGYESYGNFEGFEVMDTPNGMRFKQFAFSWPYIMGVSDLAPDNKGVAVSSDQGSTWEVRTVPSTIGYCSVCSIYINMWESKKRWIVGGKYGQLAISNDTHEWKPVIISGAVDRTITAIIPRIVENTWNTSEVLPGGGVANFIIALASNLNSTSIYRSTTNGESWTLVKTVPVRLTSGTYFRPTKQFLLCGENKKFIILDKEGLNPKEIDAPDINFSSCTSNNNVAVVVNLAGKIYTSKDLILWNERTHPNPFSLSSVYVENYGTSSAIDNCIFIAAGDGNENGGIIQSRAFTSREFSG